MLMQMLALLVLNPASCDPMMCGIEGCPPGCDIEVPPGGGPPIFLPPPGYTIWADFPNSAWFGAENHIQPPTPGEVIAVRPIGQTIFGQELIDRARGELGVPITGCDWVVEFGEQCDFVPGAPPVCRMIEKAVIRCTGELDPDYTAVAESWLGQQFKQKFRDLVMIPRDELMFVFGRVCMLSQPISDWDMVCKPWSTR